MSYDLLVSGIGLVWIVNIHSYLVTPYDADVQDLRSYIEGKYHDFNAMDVSLFISFRVLCLSRTFVLKLGNLTI